MDEGRNEFGWSVGWMDGSMDGPSESFVTAILHNSNYNRKSSEYCNLGISFYNTYPFTRTTSSSTHLLRIKLF